MGFSSFDRLKEIRLQSPSRRSTTGPPLTVVTPRGGRLLATIVAALALAFAPAAFAAQEGDLDEAFSTDGKVTYPSPFSTEVGSDVLVQSNGKVLAIGSSTSNSFGVTTFNVVRYNEDGSLDSGFGTNGRTTVPFGGNGADSLANAAALQSDGKIVVVGETTADAVGSGSTSSYRKVAIARLKADGTLDATFGTSGSGKRIVDLGSGLGNEASASDVVIESGASPDIVIGGSYAINTADADFVLLRMFPNQAIRTKFVDFSTGGNDFVNAVALDNAGRVVIAGESTPPSATNGDFAVARLLDNVSSDDLDAGFSGDGKLVRDINGDDSAADVVVRPDDSILIGGTSQLQGSGIPSKFALLGLDNDGTDDTSFGSGGDGDEEFGLAFSANRLGEIALQPDGRILVAGTTQAETSGSGGTSSDDNFALLRRLDGGSLDSTFGSSNGAVFTDFSSESDDRAAALALTGDDRVVLGGDVDADELAVARYKVDLDATPPVATIDSGPSGTTSSNDPSFTFSSEPRASFTCSPGARGGVLRLAAELHRPGRRQLPVQRGREQRVRGLGHGGHTQLHGRCSGTDDHDHRRSGRRIDDRHQ